MLLKDLGLMSKDKHLRVIYREIQLCNERKNRLTSTVQDTKEYVNLCTYYNNVRDIEDDYIDLTTAVEMQRKLQVFVPWTSGTKDRLPLILIAVLVIITGVFLIV